MKKYLMTGIAALAMCAAFTSCSKDTEFEPLTQEQLDQQKAEQITLAYNQAFVKTFGQPASNQTWGFGTITRGAEPNSNQWFDGVTAKYKHLVQPADVTAREEEVVTQWFLDNRYPTCDEIYLTEFFVQQVHFGTEEYSAVDQNNTTHKVVGGRQMDYLYAWDPAKNEKDHINNFNTSSPQREATGLQNMQLMMNSSTETFGFHESFNSQNQRYYLTKNRNWVIKAIEVDGVWGYYVGFDYESHGNQGEFEPNGYFDDRIIKIVPGDGIVIPPYDGRIMAEDLCAQEGSDFDFNDVVFDWKVIENGAKAKIHLLAAGGTMSLRIGGTKDNANSGVEVHAKFGVNPDIMVNTATDGAPKVVVKPYQDFEILASEANLNAFNADGSDIPIYVKKDGVWVELTAYTGAPAAKINCPVGTAWVDEYAKITWAYPNFAQYVNQPSIKWWENVNPTWVNLLLSDNTNPPTE